MLLVALFGPKHYSAEQAANLIMGETLPSDTKKDFDDFLSSATHLSTKLKSNLFSEISDTGDDHNEVTDTTRGATTRREECVLEVAAVFI